MPFDALWIETRVRSNTSSAHLKKRSDQTHASSRTSKPWTGFAHGAHRLLCPSRKVGAARRHEGPGDRLVRTGHDRIRRNPHLHSQPGSHNISTIRTEN